MPFSWHRFPFLSFFPFLYLRAGAFCLRLRASINQHLKVKALAWRRSYGRSAGWQLNSITCQLRLPPSPPPPRPALVKAKSPSLAKSATSGGSEKVTVVGCIHTKGSKAKQIGSRAKAAGKRKACQRLYLSNASSFNKSERADLARWSAAFAMPKTCFSSQQSKRDDLELARESAVELNR